MIEHITGHDEKVGHNDIPCANHDGSTATPVNATDCITPDLSTPSPTTSTATEAASESPQRRRLYDNLSAGQFRLLRLRAKEKDDDDIRCCLQTFTAASRDCPSYRAVSYAWGPKTSTTPIRISSQCRTLQRETTFERRSLHSQNLFDLLNQLRSEQSDCWLWIDALCINQDNADERSQQVKIMGDIFRTANTVLAWLGPFTHVGPNQWDDQSGVARDVETMIQRDHDTHAGMHYNKNYSSYPQLVEGQGICALPYWQRRWIVQELLRAQSVVLQVREKQFTMAALEKAVKLADADASGDRRIRDKIAGSAAALLARHRLGKRTGTAIPQLLKELLVMYEDQECQQSYDLVYAMHSLIEPKKHRDKLQVDYKQSAEEHFCVAVSFMHEHEDLGIEGVRIAWMLLKGKDPSSIDAFRMPSQSTGLHQSFHIGARAFKLGSCPEQSKESGLSIRARRNVAAMSPILPWVLQPKSGSLAPEQRTQPYLASNVCSIGPQDMLFFIIPGTTTWGLAAMAEPQFSTKDEIWLFAHTSYAFIVLPNVSGSMTIRGRAALFNSDGTSYIGSELYPYPLRPAEDIKSTAACVEMRLTIPDLITLATMANKAYVH
ncbi:hypothetical protein LTR56_002171 [Elasticomyces elasticus]|nr:hypothetical protein LTR56_002171 [Elasticomyces elasticus]KAK3666050.1 hypothetical protein LTR22_003053 [Elasticomyces elasticus]KAK4929537.1 hypothetical protein LTR49_003832 [Elasticomyces elasticus]KAK5767505.1 hypothetical protein LTS12_002346 [Elasticomyces elasticus]